MCRERLQSRRRVRTIFFRMDVDTSIKPRPPGRFRRRLNRIRKKSNEKRVSSSLKSFSKPESASRPRNMISPPPPDTSTPTLPAHSPRQRNVSPPPSKKPPQKPKKMDNLVVLKSNPWRDGVVDLLMSLNTNSPKPRSLSTDARHGESGRELFHAAMLACMSSQSLLPTRQWQSEDHLLQISKKISKLMQTCVDRRSFLRKFRTIKKDLKSVILPPAVKISKSQIMKDLLRERFRIEGKLLESHLRTSTIEPLIRYLKILLIRERGT